MASVTTSKPNGHATLQVELPRDATPEHAAALLVAGKITPQQFAVWSVEREKAITARAARSASGGNVPKVAIGQDGKLAFSGATVEQCTVTQFFRRLLGLPQVLELLASQKDAPVRTIAADSRRRRADGTADTFTRYLKGALCIGYRQADADGLDALCAEVRALIVKLGEQFVDGK